MRYRKGIPVSATIRLPDELKETLRQEAERKGYTIKDVITFILWNYFEQATALK